jgi:hypothetical protein
MRAQKSVLELLAFYININKLRRIKKNQYLYREEHKLIQ